MNEGINLHIDGAIATITINRLDKRNALALADLGAIGAALDEAAAAAVRVLVLTGAGDRAFSAGVDLSDVASDDGTWDENPLRVLSDRLEAFPASTIARINGAVIGGAAELTFACDFRVGVDTAKLMVPAARIGLHYEPAGLRRAMGVVGLQGARRIYLAAESMDAETLDRLGYFDRLVPRTDLDAATAELAGALAGGAPLSVNGMKRTLNELSQGALDEAAAKKRVAESWASEDMKEGLAAIREKRAPDFKGR